MSVAPEVAGPTLARIGGMLALGWVLMLIDSLWGGLAVLGIGFSGILNIALSLGLVAGLPAYALDVRSERRIIVFLPALYVLRWIVEGNIGPALHVGPPWRGSWLLIVAAVLLQWCKLMWPRARRSSELYSLATRPR